ncbi:MAG: FAD:protein FMN transferase [Chloroflexota bacterium]|nr:FAD:protein FMN transferase [Chloroflexota bacterium]MDE3101069.1 FAD:protein FMN transferase [Chloroflexota bacterium]
MTERVERTFRAMGTSMRFIAYAADAAGGQRALEAAEERTRSIEARFSRFIASSELSRLNAFVGSPVAVSRDMAEVLGLALEQHHATGGLFDPAILPDLERAGYDRTFDEIDPDAARPGPSAHATFADLEWDGRTVRTPHGMRIDLGGIVKGWTADRIADQLARVGPVLVDLGGDIAVRGTPPGESAWTVAVEDPAAGPALAALRVTTGAIATSGTYRRRWTGAAGTMHHLIDPRTGRPAASDLVAVVALHPRAVIADVWAKCVLLERPQRRAALIASCPGLEVILVPVSGIPVGTGGALARCIDGSANGVAA